MTLKKYVSKRNLKISKEPKAKLHRRRSKEKLRFVVQKHAARQLHYDFRLELDGVLKSWAVPKGPSMNPKDKRLAIQVEDHPYDYKDFEGVIPEGYGAGVVIVWDEGVYTAENPHEGLKVGKLDIFLQGKKLKGGFHFVKLKGRENQWLLIKMDDEFATKSDVLKKDKSVVSGQSLNAFIKKQMKDLL